MAPFFLKIKIKFSCDCVVRFSPILILTLYLLVPGNGYSQSFAKNKKPNITGQKALTLKEEESLTLQLIDLTVEDKDDWFYPLGFTLKVYSGDNYTLSGNTITPGINFSGSLSVPVSVNDGRDDSDKFNVKITVLPQNDAPVITGQQAISTDEDKPFTIQTSDLIITDPDNSQFTITISNGSNYTFSGLVVTPSSEFNGTLSIPVQVNDGELNSPLYYLQLKVNAANDPPKITAQQMLTTTSVSPIAIELSHLTVVDTDNQYPTGFKIIMLNGTNYTLDGSNVIPNSSFTGNLTVPVKVNDGTSDSEQFNLVIAVTQGKKDDPVITNQAPVIINEDESFTLSFSHLTVTDNDSNYPQGFSLSIATGNNYIAFNNTITPLPNFSGSIFASVTVNDGTNVSDPFNFTITVRPVNDAPRITLTDIDSLIITPGKSPQQVFKEIAISDIDNDSLVLAEVGFKSDNYQPGNDILSFSNTSSIRGVYDSKVGVLALLGKASIDQYLQAIKSIQVNVLSESGTIIQKKKTIYLIVNDGLANSNRVEKNIRVSNSDSKTELEIPTGFTPNGDFVNDTWGVRPLKNPEDFKLAIVRVYNKTGLMVFETTGLSKEWDGHYNGNELPADVYFYTVDLKTNNSQSNLKGIVTILR